MISLLKDLLYEEDPNVSLQTLKNVVDSEFLHAYATNYNWDNGLLIPKTIIENPYCDLGTALLIFYNADGYTYLQNTEVNESESNEWIEFLSMLFGRIKEGSFRCTSIPYNPPLTKVQKYKLKKESPNVPMIFLEQSPGNKIDVTFI